MNARLFWRMTAPIIGVSLLLLLLGAIAGWYVHQLQHQATTLLLDSIDRANAAQQVEFLGSDIRNHLSEFVITNDGQHLRAITDIEPQVIQLLSDIKGHALTEQGQELIQQLNGDFEFFFQQFHSLHSDNPTESDRQIARRLFEEIVRPRILPLTHRYRDLNEQVIETLGKRNEVIADRLGLALLLLGVCGAVGGLLSGFGLARGIHRSIVELNVSVMNAAGALSEVVAPVAVTSSSTIEELGVSMEHVAKRVAAVVERLQTSQREALRAEQLADLGQLAAGLAHELRNPLTSMKTLVQAAREHGPTGTLDGRDLEILEEEITRLNDAIQLFLDYARPPKPVCQRVDLRDLVSRTIQLVSLRAEQQDVSIVMDFPDELPPFHGDPQQMRQVLLNLFLNAFESMPHGGTLSINGCVERPPGDGEAGAHPVVVIEVTDTGGGIPAGVETRMFEPFFSTKETGTGLGLPVCVRIIEEHGGVLEATNSRSGGAVFTLRLPLDSVPANTLPSDARSLRIP